MRATLERIPRGKAGLNAKLRRIRGLVEKAKQDPVFRQAVVGIVRQVPERSWQLEVSTIMDWVRDHVRYTLDPAGLELFVAPQLLLQQGLAGDAAGDCDDHVMLAAAMLETLGHPVRYRVGGPGPGKFRHIWLDVLQRGRGWVPMELTKNDAALGWDPAKLFPHIETYKGGTMSGLGEVPTIERVALRVAGWSNTTAPMQAASLGPQTYWGLLPSDLLRIQAHMQNAPGITVEELAGAFGLGDLDLGNLSDWELEGLKKLFKKLKKIPRKYVKYLKRIPSKFKKYGVPLLKQFGPMAAMAIPGIGPMLGPLLGGVMGGIGGGAGGIFGSLMGGGAASGGVFQRILGGIMGGQPGGQFMQQFAGRDPAQLDRFGALFSGAVGGRGGPDIMGRNDFGGWQQQLLRSVSPYLQPYLPSWAPRIGPGVEQFGGGWGGSGRFPQPSGYGRPSRWGLGPQENPYRFGRGFASSGRYRSPTTFVDPGLGAAQPPPSGFAGGLPLDLGLERFPAQPGDTKQRNAWHRDLQTRMFAEMARLKRTDHRWRVTKLKALPPEVMADYPGRAGAREGGMDAFTKDFGLGAAGVPAMTVLVWMIWGLAKDRSNLGPGITERMEWLRGALSQNHARMWNLAKTEKAKAASKAAAAAAAAKGAEEARAAAKKEREAQAAEAEAQRKLEKEQAEKELAHRRALARLEKQRKSQQISENEAARRRAELERAFRAGVPGRRRIPPPVAPGAPPPPVAAGDYTGLMLMGGAALLLFLVLKKR